jgi:hypothetical protein
MGGPVNKTGRAIVGIAVLAFCIGTIVWLIAWGDPKNSLDTSSLSWSYTIILVTMAAFGLDMTASTALTALLNQRGKNETV